jgi:hypothetical protein
MVRRVDGIGEIKHVRLQIARNVQDLELVPAAATRQRHLQVDMCSM